MPKVKLILFEDLPIGNFGYVAEHHYKDCNHNVLFSTTESRGIAHDLIEHPKLDGTVEDELMAFGAIWYARGTLGDLNRDNVNFYYSADQSLEIAEIVSYRYNRDLELNGYSKIRVSSDIKCYVDEIDDLLPLISDYYARNNTYEKKVLSIQQLADIRHYLVTGLRRVHRIYGDVVSANNMYYNMKYALDTVWPKVIDDDSPEIMLDYCYKTQRCSAEVVKIPPDPYDY